MKESERSYLFDIIINELEKYNIQYFHNYCENLADEEDIKYFSYKLATTQAMLLKKWMREGMEVSPQKMAYYYLKDALKLF